jgi:hypothetical protein
VKGKAFLLDLGAEVDLYTERGPRRPATCWWARSPPSRPCAWAFPRHGVLHYPMPVDPLDFAWEGGTLAFPGLRVYLEGPPEFVETPYYAWVVGWPPWT